MMLLGTFGLFMLLTRILPQNISIFESMGLTVPGFLTIANYLIRSVEYHWIALVYLIPASINTTFLPFRTYLVMINLI
jgi:type II secretory pathway component PulF